MIYRAKCTLSHPPLLGSYVRVRMHAAADVMSSLCLVCSRQAQAFTSWKDLVAYQHAKRTAMSDSVRRLLQGSLGRAFAAWSSRVHEKAALQQKAVQCLARLTHAHAASAFTAWIDWAAEQKEHRSALLSYQPEIEIISCMASLGMLLSWFKCRVDHADTRHAASSRCC